MAHNQDYQSLKPLLVPKLKEQKSWKMKGTISKEDYERRIFAESWKREK